MNISTNYKNVQTPSVMLSQNSTKYVDSQNTMAGYDQNSVNFTGMKDLLIPIRKIVTRPQQKDTEFMEFTDYSAGILHKSPKDIEKELLGKTKARLDFFGDIVEKYNQQNFSKKPNERENANEAFKLFEQVKKPEIIHSDIVCDTDLSLAQAGHVFEKLENNPKKLTQAYKVYKDLNDVKLAAGGVAERQNRRNKIFMQMVDSPNSEEIFSKYETYRPYIFKNANNENVITELNTKIASKSYVKDYEKKTYQLDMLLADIGNCPLAQKDILPHFTEEGNDMLALLACKFRFGTEISAKDKKSYLNIYKTTTEKNMEPRARFLSKSYYNHGLREFYGEDEIQNIDKLFGMMDENPDTMKFVKNMTKEGRVLKSVDSYIKLVEGVDPAVLKNDVKNINKLAVPSYKNGEYDDGIQKYLDHYNDKPQSRAGRLIGHIKSWFGKKQHASAAAPVYQVEQPTAVMEPAAKKDYTHPTVLNAAEAVKPTEVREAETPKHIVKHRVFFKPVVEKAPSAKKMVIINDVNNVIEKKLGKNVYADQKKTYARHATKMRLNMLPEIFDSIKDTRATARKNGTFNKRTTVKNEDALALYRRINGKNKRLVNYMLKVRNEDGSRKYNIKEIVETLDNTKKAAAQAKANPFGGAKDEKALCNEILNNKIAEFGKLKRERK